MVGTRHGTVSVRPSQAEPGDTVTITARPDSGYRLSQLTATAGQRQRTLRDLGGGVYTFTMPASAVEVEGVFTAEETQPLPFADVAETAWYHDAVRYVYENGLMSGTTPDSFSPGQPTNRGMIVFILYKLAGSPESGLSDFTDVPAGQYYSGAAAWAAANGIISGYAREAVSWACAQGLISGTSSVTLTPAGTATRAQAAVILQKFCETVLE
ncbi:MAG: S-layer homology domain-containing protein [Lawsonibacter sp.]|nr:S-layer homology domain-containing protein [Lawsonibacter sp.]